MHESNTAFFKLHLNAESLFPRFRLRTHIEYLKVRWWIFPRRLFCMRPVFSGKGQKVLRSSWFLCPEYPERDHLREKLEWSKEVKVVINQNDFSKGSSFKTFPLIKGVDDRRKGYEILSKEFYSLSRT